MSRLFIAFFKFTAWLPVILMARNKLHFEDKKVQDTHLDGPAIIICNHTSLYDYPIVLFAFWRRIIRCETAEIMFQKDRRPLGTFLKMMGAIKVDRTGHDFSFMNTANDILAKGGVVLVFPESRLPKPDEKRPLPFVPSVAMTALTNGVKVIPLYTTGSYFKSKRNHLMIGTPLEPCTWVDETKTQAENIEMVTARFKEEIIRLGGLLNE